MRKIYLFLFMLLLMLFNGCSHNNKENVIHKNQTNEMNKIKEIIATPVVTPIICHTVTPLPMKKIDIKNNEFLNNLKELCKSSRRFETGGEQRTLNFLDEKMTECGYQTQKQKFCVYKKTNSDIYSATVWQYFNKYSGEKDSAGKGTNLIATMPNPDKKRTLYITAHYDTTRDTNGIRDNGSGVVVSMEIARQLQNISLPVNVEFIFFSAEEAGMQGSNYFVSQLTQEEKDTSLGCINIDVVGEKGDNEIVLKTYSSQMNALSLRMDDYYKFSHSRSEASDHTSFYMGKMPAIYFADDNVNTKDITNHPSDELDINKLTQFTKVICNFIIDFNVDKYYHLIKYSYTKEYTDLPDSKTIKGYSLIQVNKILRADGAGSDIVYIWENNDGNQVNITEKDSRFLDSKLEEEIEAYNSYNNYTKYQVSVDGTHIIVKYIDLVSFRLYECKGDISKDDLFKLLKNQNDVIYNVAFINALD